MGAVYRAEHLVLQAPVAIKVIEREVADEGTKARFMREAQAAAALRSPHVVQILDYGTEDDFPFMVMELLEGETLARRIKRKKRLSAQETTWILTHVGRAVAKAHELGVVHRDLKPDNVFLVRNEEDEIAKVLDFGVAKIEATSLTGDSHTRTGSLLGTPYYMSPEQAQGNKAVDHRSDLWALGVIAFECLTGKRPFASEGLGDLVLQICIRDLPVPSALAPVPIGFDAWFAKAVQREPDDRFQSAKELTDSLRDALGAKDSPSVPEILVTTAPESTPLPSSSAVARVEDARATAIEGAGRGSVDAAAETLIEEVAPFSAAELARSGAPGGSLPAPSRREGISTPPAARAVPQEPAKRRSNTGLFLAVGSGALAVGVLTAVLALGDRPGFRVGDIEGPVPTTTQRGAGSRPADSGGAEPAIGAGQRQPAQPRAQRSSGSAAEGADADPAGSARVIDGRSILDPASAATDPEGSEESGKEGEPTGGEPGANGNAESDPPPESGQPADGKSADGKTADGKTLENKGAEAKPGDPKAPAPKADGQARPDAAEPKPASPKTGESGSGDRTPPSRPAEPPPTDTKPTAPVSAPDP